MDSPVDLIPGLRIVKQRLNEDMPNNPTEWDLLLDMQDMPAVNVDQLLDAELVHLKRQRQASLETDRSLIFAKDVARSVELILRKPRLAWERLVVIDANLPILGQGLIDDEVLRERAILLAAALRHHKPFIFVDYPEDEAESRDKGKGKMTDEVEDKRLLTLYETPSKYHPYPTNSLPPTNTPSNLCLPGHPLPRHARPPHVPRASDEPSRVPGHPRRGRPRGDRGLHPLQSLHL